MWYGLPDNDTVAKHNWQDTWRVEEGTGRRDKDRVGGSGGQAAEKRGPTWQPSSADGCHRKASGSREVMSHMERLRGTQTPGKRNSGHRRTRKAKVESSSLCSGMLSCSEQLFRQQRFSKIDSRVNNQWVHVSLLWMWRLNSNTRKIKGKKGRKRKWPAMRTPVKK